MDALKAGAAGSDDDDDEPGQNLYAGGVGRGGGGSGQVFSNKQISLKNSFPRDHAPVRPCAQHAGPVWRVFVQLPLRDPACKARMTSECEGLCAERD